MLRKSINLAELMRNPPEKNEWAFNENETTFLQTDSLDEGKVHWYLTKSLEDTGGYHIEITANPISTIDTLVHLSEKAWVTNKGQLFEAVLPVLRTIRANQFQK